MNKKEEIIISLKNLLKEKAHIYDIEMAFLYGSWATGIPRHDSDIDIALVFSKEPSSDEQAFNFITDLSISLSTKINREVNVIQIHKDFRNPMLYYNAIVLGLPLFVKDKYKYISLRNEAIYQMEDFSIFGRNWQLEVTRKNLEALKHG